MNILQRLFTREATTVEATTADVLGELEAEEKRKRVEEAAQEARVRRETAEYRARNAATQADFLKRKDLNARKVNADVVALLRDLTDTRALVIESANIPFDGTFKSTEEVFGFPIDFASKIIAALVEAAPSTQWDFSGEGQPKPKEPQAILLPRFRGDNAAPPGFVGAWDVVNARPMDA